MKWKINHNKHRGSWELERKKYPFKPRSFSSFYTKNKRDYSGIFIAMSGDRSRM